MRLQAIDAAEAARNADRAAAIGANGQRSHASGDGCPGAVVDVGSGVTVTGSGSEAVGCGVIVAAGGCVGGCVGGVVIVGCGAGGGVNVGGTEVGGGTEPGRVTERPFEPSP